MVLPLSSSPRVLRLDSADGCVFPFPAVYMHCQNYPIKLAFDPFGKARREELPLLEEGMDDHWKRQDSTEFPVGFSFNDTEPLFWDDADASYFAGVDFDAILANLTELGY